jgi:cytosine/adenosine deaminase-related metal-dependent hydrolase
LILSAPWVLPISGPPIRDGAILVHQGEIAAVGPSAEIRQARVDVPVQHFEQAALLPGFVNAHTHLDYTAFRGLCDDAPLARWLRECIVAGGARLSLADFAASARLGAWESLRSGVTTIADTSYTGASFDVARSLRLRGIFYQEVFGYRSPDPTQHIEHALAAMRARREEATDLQSIGIAPHTPYTVTVAVMDLVSELLRREQWPVHIHAAETVSEVQFVREGTGVFAESLAGRGLAARWVATGLSPIGYLAHKRVLGPRTVVAHAVHVDGDDIALLAASGTSVVHCPKSNAKLGAGIAPVLALLDAGIRVGLGTDSAASNNKLDIFEEMRFALLLQRAVNREADAISSAEVLRLATLGGAQALGLDDLIGSLVAGKRADIIAVNLEGPLVAPVVDPIPVLVHNCSQRDVLMTMVDGEVLFDGTAVRGLGALTVQRDAEAVAATLRNGRTGA